MRQGCRVTFRLCFGMTHFLKEKKNEKKKMKYVILVIKDEF